MLIIWTYKAKKNFKINFGHLTDGVIRITQFVQVSYLHFNFIVCFFSKSVTKLFEMFIYLFNQSHIITQCCR